MGSQCSLRPKVYIINIPSQKTGMVRPIYDSGVTTLSGHLPRHMAAIIPASDAQDTADYQCRNTQVKGYGEAVF